MCTYTWSMCIGVAAWSPSATGRAQKCIIQHPGESTRLLTRKYIRGYFGAVNFPSVWQALQHKILFKSKGSLLKQMLDFHRVTLFLRYPVQRLEIQFNNYISVFVPDQLPPLDQSEAGRSRSSTQTWQDQKDTRGDRLWRLRRQLQAEIWCGYKCISYCLSFRFMKTEVKTLSYLV